MLRVPVNTAFTASFKAEREPHVLVLKKSLRWLISQIKGAALALKGKEAEGAQRLLL